MRTGEGNGGSEIGYQREEAAGTLGAHRKTHSTRYHIMLPLLKQRQAAAATLLTRKQEKHLLNGKRKRSAHISL